MPLVKLTVSGAEKTSHWLLITKCLWVVYFTFSLETTGEKNSFRRQLAGEAESPGICMADWSEVSRSSIHLRFYAALFSFSKYRLWSHTDVNPNLLTTGQKAWLTLSPTWVFLYFVNLESICGLQNTHQFPKTWDCLVISLSSLPIAGAQENVSLVIVYILRGSLGVSSLGTLTL